MAGLTTGFQMEKSMTRNDTRTTELTTRLSTRLTKPEIRAEIKKREAVLLKMTPAQQYASPEYADICWLTVRLYGTKSGNHFESDQIERADATLRGSWTGARVGVPVDTDWSDEERDTTNVEADGCREGWRYGQLSESPEDQGPRFNTPSFLLYYDSFNRYRDRLFEKRKKEHPSLVEFEQFKAGVDSQILRTYFLDHASYEEIFDEFGRVAENDPYGVYDVSTKDATTVEEAVEFASQKNGTFSCFDEDDKCYTFFDVLNRRFRKATARKINDKLFRVDFRVQNEDDKYYLPAKLDPSKKESTRPLQRYIDALVEEGRALMKQAKPTKAERKAASLRREADKERVIARNQLGAGTNPGQWEHTSTLSDQSHKPTQGTALQKEYGKLSAKENKFRFINEDKETKGLDPYQLWQRDQERGEKAYQEFMALTRVDQAVARFAQPWHLPVEPESVVEPKLAAPRTPYVVPAVKHEALRISLLALLACMAQGRPTMHIQGSLL
jgi:hypothetical protein